MHFLTEVSGPPITDTLPARWIFDRIEEWAKRTPNQLALAADYQDRVQEFRFAELLESANAVAAGVYERGIKQGDRVGILMENVPQWVFALLGVMRIGAITVPLPTTLPESSIRLLVEHAGCKLIIADEQNWEKARQVGEAKACLVAEILSKSGDPHQACPAAGCRADLFQGERFNTAIIIYTSGTTGNPKGVELTYDNLNNEIRGAIELLQMSPNHRILSVLPFSHVLPLIANALGPLCAGAGVVFLSSISPQRIIDAFHRHRITFFVCVPQFFYVLHRRIFSQVSSQPLFLRLLFRSMRALGRRVNSPAFRRMLFSKVHDAIGPDLWLLASGGSRFEPRIAKELSELGYTVLQAYGLTESSAAATITPMENNHLGTVGRPIRGVTVRVDSPNANGVGEVCIRGPILMKGYYHSPNETSEAICDGWLRTGDLGFIAGDGFLSITGRSKDVIVLANGENVYPEELETHYSQSPFIKEVCILGVAESGGEILHAVVVPDLDEFRRRGQTAIMEMIRFEIENLSKELPSFYRIHSISIRNEPLPRTVTRKLKRFEIEREESDHRNTRATAERGAPKQDHPRFKQGVGAVLAELIHEAKPEAGALDPAMNLELDLGFDSLGRVELLALAEGRLGTHIPEERATRIFTIGELIDAFEASTATHTVQGQSWKEILNLSPSDELKRHYILNARPLLNPLLFIAMRFLRVLSRILFRMRCYGLENLPQTMPFLICPNHESFLDGPLLVSLLPRRVIYKMFIHGYADYWENALSRRLAKTCNIVAIDPNVNLVRAMQVAAVGLKHGRALLIFPEGTRSIDGRVAAFKKGAAILAYELAVPIVPVGIRGTFEAWPRGGNFRLHPIEFHFGKPIDPMAFAKADDPYKAVTERLRTEVAVLSGHSIDVT
jgi:long-chain acyl-CoA synthetase